MPVARTGVRACPCALVTLGFFFTSVSVFAQGNGQAALNDYEMGGFIAAFFGDKEGIGVQMLSEVGQGATMLKSLRRLGAKVEYGDEKVGFAMVLLPREKCLDLLDLPGVAYARALTRDSFMYRLTPERSWVLPAARKPKPVPPIFLPIPRVGTSLPKDGPYFAAAEAGLLDLWKDHPKADGRGVRVAVVDEGIDLLHPSLQLARDADGNLVPKVADIIAVSDPAKSSNWVQFATIVEAKGGTFAAAQRTWTAPAPGTYRFGLFTKELPLGFFRDWEKKQDPRLKKVSLSVGALWDERSNRVWIDTDGDGDFRNQRPLGDYAQTHDIDWFGRKEGADDNRIPFGVKIDRQGKAAYLSIAVGGHGMIAGPLAANRLSGGLFDGAAPSAQLIDAIYTPFWPALLSALARPDVDVVNWSGGLGRHFEDGSDDFNRHLLTRALEVYKKPFVACAGVPNSFNVSDYASPEMLRRNRQTHGPYVECVNGGGVFSPDGLVNTIAAPSAQLGTESRYMPDDFIAKDGQRYDGQGRRNAFAPPGYDIGANPSPTIPVVSGVLADIISEAKRQHIRYDSTRLTQAVLTGTRWISGIPARMQGFGLVNAAGAWKQLSSMAGGDDPSNPVLTSFAAARMENGKQVPVNGFVADVPKAGGVLEVELWLTRKGGYPDGRAYLLSVRGDKDIYTVVDDNLTFVRDRPQRVRLQAHLRPGWNIGFLQLRDAQAGVVMQEVPLSVRVPEIPHPVAPFVETYRQTIPPRRYQFFYMRLEEDTQATRYLMRIPYVGFPDLFCGLPGHPRINNVAPTGPPVDDAHHVGPMQNIEMVTINEGAGLREGYWSNRASAEYEQPWQPPAPDVPVQAELRLERFAVGFDDFHGRSVRVTNKQADIHGRVEFYDAKLANTDLPGTGPHATATMERMLPANLSQWRVSLTASPGAQGDLDAFLLDCTDKKAPSLAKVAHFSSSGAMLVVDNPKHGKWLVVIRARRASQRAISYQIREAFLEANASSSDKEAKHASGTSWQAAVPAKKAHALYCAFVISGKPFRIFDDSGKEQERYHFAWRAIGVPVYNGSTADMRIAMTPLTPGGP